MNYSDIDLLCIFYHINTTNRSFKLCMQETDTYGLGLNELRHMVPPCAVLLMWDRVEDRGQWRGLTSGNNVTHCRGDHSYWLLIEEKLQWMHWVKYMSKCPNDQLLLIFLIVGFPKLLKNIFLQLPVVVSSHADSCGSIGTVFETAVWLVTSQFSAGKRYLVCRADIIGKWYFKESKAFV